MKGTLITSRVLVIHTLPALVGLIALLLTVGGTALAFFLIAGSHLESTLLRPNPFAAYEALWPGESISSVAAYGRQTTEGHISCVAGAALSENYPGLDVHIPSLPADADSAPFVCTDSPQDGTFRLISVTLDHDQVQELTLVPNALEEDSLLSYWGAANTVTKPGNAELFYLHWDLGTYSALALVLGPGAEVERLTLTEG